MRDAGGVEYPPLLTRDLAGLTYRQCGQQRAAGRIGDCCTDLPRKALAQTQPGWLGSHQTQIQGRVDDGRQRLNVIAQIIAFHIDRTRIKTGARWPQAQQQLPALTSVYFPSLSR